MIGIRQFLPGPAIAAYLAVQAIIGAWRDPLSPVDRVYGRMKGIEREEEGYLQGFIGQVEQTLLEQFFTGTLQGERVPEATETLLACMLTLPVSVPSPPFFSLILSSLCGFFSFFLD